MERSELINTHRVTLHSAAAALAVPTLVTHGGDITSWRLAQHARNRKASPRLACILIDGAGTLDLTAAKLYGWDETSAKWRFLADLNDAGTISLTVTLGYASVLYDVGLYSRLAVSGTLSASTVTVIAVPLEVLD